MRAGVFRFEQHAPLFADACRPFVVLGRARALVSRSAAASSLPLSPPLSSTKPPPIPPAQPWWLFSPTIIPPAPPRAADDLQLGLIPTRPDVVLGLPDVGPAVAALTTALCQRALDIPLLFSSLALDVSAPTIAGLIETFLATLSASVPLSFGLQRRHPLADFAPLMSAAQANLGQGLRRPRSTAPGQTSSLSPESASSHGFCAGCWRV